ncbi:MAG: T9SS type A sorting domain-containing protein [Saprospiraceae bacterium]
MKKTLLLPVFIFLFTAPFFAQDYQLTVTNEPYTDLQNPISLNNGEIWDDPEYEIPIGFDFSFYDATFDSLFMSFGPNELMENLNADVSAYFALYGLDLIDKALNPNVAPGDPGSVSPISYQLEGNAGDRIFKFECKNCGLYDDFDENDIPADFVNFQMWLYESSGDIALHFGESDLTKIQEIYDDYDEPLSLLFAFDPYLNQNFGNSPEGLVLTGLPTAPELSSLTTGGDIAISDQIPNGTVYTISNSTVSTYNPTNNSTNFKLTPNPVKNSFQVIASDTDTAIDAVRLLNINGQTIKYFDPSEDMDISELPNGYYFLEIKSDNLRWVEKLVKI